ncbi:hypothetical protein [Singulisphaera sp. PoT]|uniref:hypothetical protein n=1 Tax=Singulisphaera sp. PoT TaxID=3411797 RepID=UPI003BF5D44E
MATRKEIRAAAAAEGGAREWTAEILKDGMTLYAWMAYNRAYDTYATDRLEHARLFRSEAEVDAWAVRLGVPNARPIRVRGEEPAKPALSRARTK